ncbi:PREDICTED: uncharacterized protein LOC106746433 [Dinoponera quadriceps]|uniref:Uncharacterized protein LOC106746433 n=1 Tax=Dinoponera quadriceps TaxID=609295 RepID=A0A6P3XKJ5_DINQU|nr:PREDICTED: uncharacterized protein LOC106746433 [Dinoponera quadriceps]
MPNQKQDLYTLQCESYLYVEGNIIAQATAENVAVTLGSNCVAFMFDEIRYELDGVEIDSNKNVGITSMVKNYISLSSDKIACIKNAAWDTINAHSTDGYFNFCIPLNLLLGFCEDYRRIVINARIELILIRSCSDNRLRGSSALEPKVKLFKIQWRMPHVLLNDINKLSLLRTLENGRYVSMSFRSWDLYEFLLLENTTKHLCPVKTATNLEKPRYVIFALQTGRKNVMAENITQFDNCNLINAKLYLNSECYPYDDMNLDFAKRKYAILYKMYKRFRTSYYGCSSDDVWLTTDDFLRRGPFVVIDCSRQNESIKSATVDVRIEFECKENIPVNTTAYCLILHDRVVEYRPLTNIVSKLY